MSGCLRICRPDKPKYAPVNATYDIRKSGDGVTTWAVKPSVEPKCFIDNVTGLFDVFFGTLLVIKREFEKDLIRVNIVAHNDI
jgi:hypothetical protein